MQAAGWSLTDWSAEDRLVTAELLPKLSELNSETGNGGGGWIAFHDFSGTTGAVVGRDDRRLIE